MSEHRETPIDRLDRWPAASPFPEQTSGTSAHLTDELLAAWTAGELADDEQIAAQRHLSACSHCQNALAETRRVRALVNAIAKSAESSGDAPSVADRVLARLPKDTQAEASSPDKARESMARETRGSVRATREQSRARQARRRSLWRRVGTLAAVLLLIASSAVLFSRLSSRGNPAFKPGPPGLANIPGNWADVLPSGASIRDVAVVSPTDIWVVGWVRTGAAVVSLQMHFDGKYWQRSPDQFALALYSISMDSADDGWGSGTTVDGMPALLHYTGGHWHNATSSLDTRTFKTPRMSLFKIAMVSPTSGWMLGEPVSTDHATQVFQYLKVGDAYHWEPIESFANVDLMGLFAISDREVWLVGATSEATARTVILRLTTTSADGTPASTATQWDTHSWDVGNGTLISISMLSSTNGWVAGGDENGAGILFHWDGHNWSQKHFVPDGQEAATIDSIMMTGANTGWAFTSLEQENYLYSMTNDQWFDYQVPEGRVIIAAAPVTSTTLLAITIRVNDEHNLDPLPVIYDMANGKPLPTPTLSP